MLGNSRCYERDLCEKHHQVFKCTVCLCLFYFSPTVSSSQLQRDCWDLSQMYFQQPLCITADGSLSPDFQKWGVPGFHTIVSFLVPWCLLAASRSFCRSPATDSMQLEIETILKSPPCIWRAWLLTRGWSALAPPLYSSRMMFPFQLISEFDFEAIKNPR